MWNYRTKLRINRPAELFPVSWVNITGAKIAAALTKHVSLSGQERTCYLSMSPREPWHWFWHVLCITLSKLDPWSGEDLSAQVIQLKNTIFTRNSNTMVMITVLGSYVFNICTLTNANRRFCHIHAQLWGDTYDTCWRLFVGLLLIFLYRNKLLMYLWMRLCAYQLYTLINSLYTAQSIDNHQSDVLKN